MVETTETPDVEVAAPAADNGYDDTMGYDLSRYETQSPAVVDAQTGESARLAGRTTRTRSARPTATPHRGPAQGRRSVRVRTGKRGGGSVPRGGRAGVCGAWSDERHRRAGGGRDPGDGAWARPIVRGGHRTPGRPRRRGRRSSRPCGRRHPRGAHGPREPRAARGTAHRSRARPGDAGRLHPECDDAGAAVPGRRSPRSRMRRTAMGFRTRSSR